MSCSPLIYSWIKRSPLRAKIVQGRGRYKLLVYIRMLATRGHDPCGCIPISDASNIFPYLRGRALRRTFSCTLEECPEGPSSTATEALPDQFFVWMRLLVPYSPACIYVHRRTFSFRGMSCALCRTFSYFRGVCPEGPSSTASEALPDHHRSASMSG